MSNPCPQPNCSGTLRSKGKGRSRSCSVCGKSEADNRGRPKINPDRPLTIQEKNDRRSKATPRQIQYALFDPAKIPEGSIGFIHRAALAGVVVARSRQRVEAENPGTRAVPVGRLSAREKRWIKDLEET